MSTTGYLILAYAAGLTLLLGYGAMVCGALVRVRRQQRDGRQS